MRKIEFRGKRIDNGEWVYGFYNFTIFDDGSDELMAVIRQHIIADENGYVWSIDKNTVGQFTGLTDKNGTKIFEGDILHCWGGEYWMGVWEFDVIVEVDDIRDLKYVSSFENIEVIGNIHEREQHENK